MTTRSRRKHAQLLVWLRAGALAALTWAGLNAMSMRPSWLSVAFAILVGALALATPELGVLAAVAALSIPVIAAQPVMGLTALIFGIVAVRYLGADGGRAFLVVGISVLGAFLGPVWAGVALAGFLLGSGEGALAAAVACVVIEALGIGLGAQKIGVVLIGGPASALLRFDPASVPATLLSAEWLRSSVTSLSADSVNLVVGGLAGISNPLVLVVQPVLWATGAGVTGMMRQGARERGNALLGLSSALVGVLIPAVGTVAMYVVVAVEIPWGTLALAVLTSAVIAVLVAYVWDRYFPLEAVPAPAGVGAARRMSMTSEDADVDELLRLIATAEDKLASQHTTTRVVMITDMKSFSTMTEEDGSVATAKAIQRHRDLLIPIVSSHEGSGKSTGGDGLVAAFETASAALLASAAMQQALVDHNVGHPGEREIWVRMGIASGEVVLDNGGRPFIGAALNLAARVMNLADGGQVFATGDVAGAADEAGLSAHSFGQVRLKNIARPVEVVEILWAEGQQPHDPRSLADETDAQE